MRNQEGQPFPIDKAQSTIALGARWTKKVESAAQRALKDIAEAADDAKARAADSAKNEALMLNLPKSLVFKRLEPLP